MSENIHGWGVRAMSIGALVRQRNGQETDPWRLALVQRELVWDESRMALLLDSLLAGYPIGTLLVCRVRGPSHVIEDGSGVRRARAASPEEVQLLDGQQRVNALLTMFSRHGRFGRFLLDMTEARSPETLGASLRHRRKSVQYIHWQPESIASDAVTETRDRCIDLSRWSEWASSQTAGELAQLSKTCRDDPRAAISALHALDPEFDAELTDAAADTAADRLARLVRLWTEPTVPVQCLDLASPAEVLHVFKRVNLEGVEVRGEDVFFAGVRTLWPDVDVCVERLRRADSDRGQSDRVWLDRVTPLRVLARLSSLASSGRSDLLPLDVSRLEGDKGKWLIEGMAQMSEDGSPALARVRTLMRLLTTRSRLGHGLCSVPPQLLDAALGWAAAHPRGSDASYVEQQLAAIDAYLAGATAFRYLTVFGLTFLRDVLRRSVAAGVAGRGFPLDEILEVVTTRWPDGRSGQRVAQRMADEEDQISLANDNAALLLSIVQGIPYWMPPRGCGREDGVSRAVEWDHIWPQARADLMRVRDPQTSRLRHHPDRGCLWWAGNLWALDQPLNNYARDRLPRSKLDWLATLPCDGMPSVWPSERFLDERERSSLQEAEEQLCSAPSKVDPGMGAFRAFARGRTLRIVGAVLKTLPEVREFGVWPGGPGGDVEDPALGDLAAALTIRLPQEVASAAPESSAARDLGTRLQGVLRLARECNVEHEFQAILDAARDVGLYARPYPGSVMFTSPENRSRMLFTLWPKSRRGEGYFAIARDASSVNEFYPHITEDSARDAIGPDGGGEQAKQDFAGFVDRVRALFSR